MNLEIGMITPPAGGELFVASGLTGMSVMRVAKAALPSALCCCSPVVTYVPDLALAFVESAETKGG